MNTSSVGTKLTQTFGGSRKQATAQAKAMIIKSDLQDQLSEKLGGFVWKVEMWPNWLQVYVDQLSNNQDTPRAGEEIADAWTDRNEEELKTMFAEVLGDQFGEIAILGHAMGSVPHMGGCCRTGCGGCLNGAHNKLLSKIQGPEGPIDRVG